MNVMGAIISTASIFNLPTLGEKKNNKANMTKKGSSENLHSKPREGVDEVSLLLRSVEITS